MEPPVEKDQWMQEWKNANVDEWARVCDLWGFEDDDNIPWETYRQACCIVENQWIEMEGEWDLATGR